MGDPLAEPTFGPPVAVDEVVAMTVDEETKLDVVAKTKKKSKESQAPQPYVAHALNQIVSLTKFTPTYFIHLSILPSIPSVRPNEEPEEPEEPSLHSLGVDPLTNPRFTTRQIYPR